MGKINSRAKGAKGERLFRDICREHGFDDARRGQQYCGANGDADVVGLPNIHIECKFVQNLNFHKAMEQSINDAKGNEMPIVASKRKYEPWLITMRVDDWFELYESWINTKDGVMANERRNKSYTNAEKILQGTS